MVKIVFEEYAKESKLIKVVAICTNINLIWEIT